MAKIATATTKINQYLFINKISVFCRVFTAVFWKFLADSRFLFGFTISIILTPTSVTGQNPVLLDKKLIITPNNWLIPVKDEVKNLRLQLDKVRTMPEKIQKASEEAIFQSWLSMLVYNHFVLFST